AAWGALESIEDVVKKKKNTRHRTHLFDSTVLPALTYASETWSLRKQNERLLIVIERAVERTMLGVSQMKDDVLYAKHSRIKWVGHVMRRNDNRWTRAVSGWIPRDVKRTAGRPPTRW
ncbi:hypothetical protein Angca_007757, partial [Angiostrongylus cantonensis]